MDAKALQQDRLGLGGHDQTRGLTGALRWLLWGRQTVEVRVGSHSGAHRRPLVAALGKADWEWVHQAGQGAMLVQVGDT